MPDEKDLPLQTVIALAENNGTEHAITPQGALLQTNEELELTFSSSLFVALIALVTCI